MEIDKLVEDFGKIDTSEYPDFDIFYKDDKTLAMGLWVLCISKDKLNIRTLTAIQISDIIHKVNEYDVNEKRILKSFNSVTGRIKTYKKGIETFYEIMRPGRKYLFSFAKEGFMFLFEPGKPYTSKAILSEKVLKDLSGTLKILDPYCGLKTLAFLKTLKNRKIEFLTVRKNLEDKDLFLEVLEDLKAEAPNIEIRHYNFGDIHDRYIISSDAFVILGHSIKNLGEKLTSAVKIEKNNFKEPHKTLSQFFDKKWDDAEPI